MSVLQGVRVVELSTRGVAAWAGSHLADWGAEIQILEPAGGSPLRTAPPVDGTGSALWTWLSRGKRSAEIGTDLSPADALELCRRADLVLADSDAVPAVLGLDARSLEDLLRPGTASLVVAAPFGLDGPYASYRAGDLGIAAKSGWMTMVRDPGREPLRAGLDFGYRGAGALMLVTALAALETARTTGVAEIAEISLQAVYAALYAPMWSMESILGFRPPPGGIGGQFPWRPLPTRDGMVGVPCLTDQHFRDLCTVAGVADLLDDPQAMDGTWRMFNGDELYPRFESWFASRTRAEVVEAAQLFRIPAAAVHRVDERLSDPQLTVRDYYRALDAGGSTRKVPRVPYLLGHARPVGRGALTEHTVDPALASRPVLGGAGTVGAVRPLDGVRVLEVGWWWSGPSADVLLASLGADVIKLESPRRPDSYRFNSAPSPGDPDWFEKGMNWIDCNHNKRSVALDLTRPEAQDAFARLVAEADVVVVQFSRRVLPQLGLTRERIHELNPRAIFVDMQGYGPDGPWEDYVGFGTAFENTSVLASVTGYEGEPASVRQTLACDPTVGFVTAAAVLLALRVRRGTDHGTWIEIPQAEVLDSLFAPEWLAVQAGGDVPTVAGNHHPLRAPHAAYRTAGDDEWMTVDVGSDGEWTALCSVLGSPELAADPRFARAGDRKRNEAELDAALASLLAGREGGELEVALQAAGVAACTVVRGADAPADPGHRAFGYFTTVRRAPNGDIPARTQPFRFERFDAAAVRPAPTLGEHNGEILGDWLGLDVAALEAAGATARGMIAPAG